MARSRRRLAAAWGTLSPTSASTHYCHEALHLKEKLTKAGYKEKVEKWDSDSDSDSSDEEDLAV